MRSGSARDSLSKLQETIGESIANRTAQPKLSVTESPPTALFSWRDLDANAVPCPMSNSAYRLAHRKSAGRYTRLSMRTGSTLHMRPRRFLHRTFSEYLADERALRSGW
jgi:hypothetical protein